MLQQAHWGQMRAWVDAYTMQLETVAAAHGNARLRASLEDTVKQVQADIKLETDEQKLSELRGVLANQQKILNDYTSFNLEAFNEIAATWRLVRADLLQTDWDLRQEVQCETQAGGSLHAWQGSNDIRVVWSPAQAQVALAFLKWVDQSQDQIPNPVEHTKRMLTKQGITAENFHLHADKLAIANPWAVAPSIIVPPGTGG